MQLFSKPTQKNLDVSARNQNFNSPRLRFDVLLDIVRVINDLYCIVFVFHCKMPFMVIQSHVFWGQ